jgi:DNA-directed RNA polymerase specialized sigma24 family protein
VTNAVYDRLRSIGVSVETADALAPVVAGLSPRKREAFFLWAMGMNNSEVASAIGCDEKTIRNMIKYIRKLL